MAAFSEAISSAAEQDHVVRCGVFVACTLQDLTTKTMQFQNKPNVMNLQFFCRP